MTASRENLNRHVQRLCDELNAAGLTPDKTDKWKVNGNGERVFHEEIYPNDELYKYLKGRGAIKKSVRWRCGKEPISDNNEFGILPNSKSYPVCRDCYSMMKEIESSISKLYDVPKTDTQQKDGKKRNYKPNRIIDNGCLFVAFLFFAGGLVLAIAEGSWIFALAIVTGVLFFIFGTGSGKIHYGR